MKNGLNKREVRTSAGSNNRESATFKMENLMLQQLTAFSRQLFLQSSLS